jgi:hypothetical protein
VVGIERSAGLEHAKAQVGELDNVATALAAQGYRISDLSEDFGEICVLPSGPLDLDAQGAL